MLLLGIIFKYFIVTLDCVLDKQRKIDFILAKFYCALFSGKFQNFCHINLVCLLERCLGSMKS